MQNPSSDDSMLASLVEEISEQLSAGLEVPWESIRREHPELVDRLRELLPTIQCFTNPEFKERLFSDSVSISSAMESRSQLGEFQLIRRIGQGGMGEVYEAMQTSLQRRVALKLVRLSNVKNDRYRIRFENEALAASRLQHPNIVPVYAIGTQDETMFYAMQLIEGETLGQFARNRNTMGETAYLTEVVRIVFDIAMALDFAHDSGIVHRDIKPSNLMLDGRRNAWVLDFGLAAFDKQSLVTVTGEMIGTLRYASPQQLLGGEDRIDRRMDVYSLIATLYELLGSEPPFANVPQSGLLQAIVHQGPVPLSDSERRVPEALCRIVGKSMERDPRDRYQSCREFADDLQRFSNGDVVQAKKVPAVIRVTRWIQTRPLTTLFAVVMLFVFMLGLGLTWRWRRELVLANELNRVQQSVIDSKEKEWKATELLAAITRMRNLHDRHDSGWLNENLKEIDVASKLVNSDFDRSTLRSEAVRTWCGNDMWSVKTLMSGSDLFQCVWNADGSKLAAGFNSTLWNRGKVTVFSGEGLSQERSLSFLSPKAMGLGTEATDGVRSLAFAKTNDRFFCGTRYGLLHSWNASDELPSKSVRAHASGVMDLQFSQEHEVLATAGYDGFVRLWHPDTLEMIQETKFDDRVNRIHFAEDEIVVSGNRIHSVRLANHRIVGPIRQVCDEGGFEFSNLTPDRRGVVVCRSEGVRVYGVHSGENIRTFRYDNQDRNPEYSDANRIEFSKNRRLMATSDRQGIKLWNYASGQLESRYQVSGNSAVGVSIHPSSNQMAVWGGSKLQILEFYESPFLQSSPTRLYEVEASDLAVSGKETFVLSMLANRDAIEPAYHQLVYEYSPILQSEKQAAFLSYGYNRIAVNDDGSKAITWNMINQDFCMLDFQSQRHRFFENKVPNITALAISNDGEVIYLAHEIPLPDRKSGTRVRPVLTAIRTVDEKECWHWENESVLKTGTPCSILQIAKRGTELVLLGFDSSIRVLDSETGKLLSEQILPGHHLCSLFADSESDTMAGNEEGELLIEDRSTAMFSRTSGLHSRKITGIGRSLDDTVVTSSEDGTILFSKPNNDKGIELLRLSFRSAAVDWMRLSADGSYLAFRCRNDHSIRFLKIDALRNRLKQSNLDW